MANKRKTKEEFDRDISEKYHEELESLDFITTKHPVTIRCKQCGYTQSFTKAANFLYCAAPERRGFCPDCREDLSTSKKWNHKRFLLEVEKRNANASNFEFLSEFTGRNNLITCRCKKCGSTFERYARAFLLNRDCPCCSYRKSHGENDIMKVLTDLDLTYTSNYVLKDFDKRKSFDFRVEYYERFFLIEYDGIQHFEFNKFLHRGDINLFYRQQEADAAKNQYCQEHNIPLLRISYNEVDDIKTIILQFLQQL